MSLTTQEFLSTLTKGITSKASATRKMGAQTRTVNLRAMPEDMTDESFVATARTQGVDASLSVKTDDERTKKANGKEIYGDAAQSLACDVLGIPEPSAETPKPRNRIRTRSAVPAPSDNASAPAEGVVATS